MTAADAACRCRVHLAIGDPNGDLYPVTVSVLDGSGRVVDRRHGDFRWADVPEPLGIAVDGPDKHKIAAAGLALFKLLAGAGLDEIWDTHAPAPLLLDVGPQELSMLPWELLRDPKQRHPFAYQDAPAARGRLPFDPPRPGVGVPVRLLVIVGDPQDKPDLGQDNEIEAIYEGLRSAPCGWHIDVLRGPTRDRLTATYRDWLRAEARIGPTDAAEHPVASRLVDHDEHPLLAAAQALALAERRLDRGGPVDDLLERAERWMKRATARTTEWHAQLADLSRIVAERNGQPDAARRMTLVAMATRRELGERHAERASIELEADRPAAAERTAQRGVTVRAELRPDGTITLSSESGSITVPDADGLLAGLRDTRKSPLVRWVRDRCMMLHDNKSMFVALDALLPAPEPGAELDLRLPAEPPLAQLPWELAALQGEPVADHPGIGALYRAPEPELLARTGVRLLQEALTAAGTTPGPIDGLHGPDTTRALETFQRRNGIFDDGIAGVRTWRALRAATGGGPRSVLVVRRDLRPPRGAAPLEEAYAQFGWQVQTVDSEQLTHIGEAGASGPVDVVHVHATMQVIGSTPYLGFGVGSGARSGPEAVPCTVLDSAVRRLARLGSTPLVVLDIVGTAKFDTETVRQLLLRNDFAAQMLSLGRCYAVLATGLAPQQRAVEAQQRLLGAATAATTAADLANRLRLNLVKGRGPAAVLPWATTALFAAVAPELMPTLNRSSSHSS